jgi:hypothetical protein
MEIIATEEGKLKPWRNMEEIIVEKLGRCVKNLYDGKFPRAIISAMLHMSQRDVTWKVDRRKTYSSTNRVHTEYSKRKNYRELCQISPEYRLYDSYNFIQNNELFDEYYGYGIDKNGYVDRVNDNLCQWYLFNRIYLFHRKNIAAKSPIAVEWIEAAFDDLAKHFACLGSVHGVRRLCAEVKALYPYWGMDENFIEEQELRRSIETRAMNEALLQLSIEKKAEYGELRSKVAPGGLSLAYLFDRLSQIGIVTIQRVDKTKLITIAPAGLKILKIVNKYDCDENNSYTVFA